MGPDSTLKQVHAMKEELAREVNYDLHALFEFLREIEEQNKDLVVSPLPDKKEPAIGQARDNTR